MFIWQTLYYNVVIGSAVYGRIENVQFIFPVIINFCILIESRGVLTTDKIDILVQVYVQPLVTP